MHRKLDLDAEKLIDKYKDQLAMSLATVVNIIDPDVFVFGGGVSNEINFLDEIKQKMKKFVAGGEFEGTFLKPKFGDASGCLLYTSPSPRDQRGSRMPSSA